MKRLFCNTASFLSKRKDFNTNTIKTIYNMNNYQVGIILKTSNSFVFGKVEESTELFILF